MSAERAVQRGLMLDAAVHMNTVSQHPEEYTRGTWQCFLSWILALCVQKCRVIVSSGDIGR